MYQRKLEKDIRCPLEYGMELFGGKWNSRIICVLAALGTLRYSELRHEMGNITDAVLASTLKGLIANGIVERRSYDEIPPRVEYSLTEKGASVVPILQSICQWAGVFYKDEGDTPMIQCQKMRPSLKKTGGRFAFVKEFLSRELPEAVMYIPEATYLAWVDMSKCLPNGTDLPDFFANKAGVLLEGGNALFVGNAAGYIRLNLAMPRSIIETGLQRMADAIRKEQNAM